MTLAIADQTWAALGACTATDPDTLFVKGAAQRQVRQVCFNCPVRLNCLIDALDSKATYGVWGGLTERERRVLLRRMPVNTDWYNWLTSSEDPIAVDIRQGRIPRLGDH